LEIFQIKMNACNTHCSAFTFGSLTLILPMDMLYISMYNPVLTRLYNLRRCVTGYTTY
jgi:hypothetical protein